MKIKHFPRFFTWTVVVGSLPRLTKQKPGKENFSSAEYKDFSNNPGKYLEIRQCTIALRSAKNFISKEFGKFDGVVADI